MSGVNPTCVKFLIENNTPQLIIDDVTTPAAKEDGRCTYEVFNIGPDECFLGDAQVTGADGMPLPAGSSRTFAIRLQGHLFARGIVGSVSDLRVMRTP